MATIVAHSLTNEPITLLSHHSDVARCPKCAVGLGFAKPWYMSASVARESYGLEHEVLRVECQHCGYRICLMPCADAKKEEGR